MSESLRWVFGSLLLHLGWFLCIRFELGRSWVYGCKLEGWLTVLRILMYSGCCKENFLVIHNTLIEIQKIKSQRVVIDRLVLLQMLPRDKRGQHGAALFWIQGKKAPFLDLSSMSNLSPYLRFLGHLESPNCSILSPRIGFGV